MIKAKEELRRNRDFLESLTRDRFTSKKSWKDAGLTPDELCEKRGNVEGYITEALVHSHGWMEDSKGNTYYDDFCLVEYISAYNRIQKKRGLISPEMILCYDLWRLSCISEIEKRFFQLNIPIDDLVGEELT